MIGQLEGKAKQSGEREKPSLRGTATGALPRGEEQIAADFSIEESGSTDGPDEERDPSDALVEKSVADGAPVEEKDAVNTTAEKSGAADASADKIVADGAPVEEKGPVDAPVEQRDPADVPVEQNGAGDAPAEERGPADAPVGQSGADGAPAEERDPTGAPVEERGPADAPAEERDPADAPVGQSGADGAPAEEKAAPAHSFYATSAGALREAWNNLPPEEPIPSEDAMVKPGVAYRRKAEHTRLAPAIRMDLQRPYVTSADATLSRGAAGEFLAKSTV